MVATYRNKAEKLVVVFVLVQMDLVMVVSFRVMRMRLQPFSLGDIQPLPSVEKASERKNASQRRPGLHDLESACFRNGACSEATKGDFYE